MNLKNGVLILECLDKSDPGSEGSFLSHMFNIMNVKHQYIEVRTKDQFISLLTTSPYKIIHITTHGYFSSSDKFLGLWTKNSYLSNKELESLKGKLKKFIVISTACNSGSTQFRNQFISATKCENFIAPKGSPYFHNSIFFCHIFYHKYFILKKSIEEIMRNYTQRYKNPHEFTHISFEDFISDSLLLKIEKVKNMILKNK